MTLSKHDRLSIIASAGAAGLYAWIDGPTGGGMCTGCAMDIDACCTLARTMAAASGGHTRERRRRRDDYRQTTLPGTVAA